MRIETIGNATLIHGNAFAVLPTLERVESIITDPPYGTGWVRGGGAVGEFKAAHEKPKWDVFRTDWLEPFLGTAPCAVFCAPSRLYDLCTVFPRANVARYRKTNVRPGGKECELIVSNTPWAPPNGKWEIAAYNGDASHHPCEKPLTVMAWVVRYHSSSQLEVVDPFMGSGTTGVACMHAGRRFIGIEQDAGHFAVACERISEAQKQQRLFA